MSHRLDPLLRPESIAVLGATERPDAVGHRVVANLLHGQYPGRLYTVNPGRSTVLGVPCYPSLQALPEAVEHVIFAISDARIEAALDDVIAHGARAATIMSALVLAADSEPPLRARMQRKIRDAGLLVCGGNGMGFYNFRDGVWACGFDTRDHRETGNVTMISHSGSGMCGIVDVEERLDFNLVVSTGQELAVAMDEYLDFALDLPETRVVGLFMETVRNPPGMIRALEKARDRGVPVVAIKVGRTALSARLAVSHTGAMAGTDSTYAALFDRCGVQRVDDMDQLATALIMFAQPHPVADGGLVAIHDSGGERQLLIDVAQRLNVPLTELAPDTVARLEALLDPGLPAVNPLDAWSAGGADYHRVMEDCFAAQLADPGAALGAVVHDRAPGSGIYPAYLQYLRNGHAASGKPAFLVANRQGTGADPHVVSVTREGFPVLDGLTPFLTGVKCLLDYRDFRRRAAPAPPDPPAAAVAHWGAQLAGGATMAEDEAVALLADFGIPVSPCRIVTSEQEALAAARALGVPVVLKTAVADVLHKTDVAGVALGLVDDAAVATAYRDIAARLGPRALVAPMAPGGGVEMLLGLRHDEQFGAVVTLGSGGVDVEVVRDVAHALPPFDSAMAARLVDSLAIRPLLEGRRGRPRPDLAAFCEVAARFSVMAASLNGMIAEADINPIIVHPTGCVAVDALVVGRPGPASASIERQEQ